MVNFSIIQKSRLEGATRIDAEYYQPEFLDFISKVKSQKSKNIGEIGDVSYGTTPTGGFFEKNGIPFIRSQNFTSSLIDTSNLVFCSEEFNNQNKKSEIKSKDILFAAVGATIGELAIVQDEIEIGNINQNIARVRIIEKNVDPYYVGLFFNSKFGQFQIERLITGNAQPYLNSEQINFLQIPILKYEKQKEIGKYFSLIQEEIKNSKILYQQAENLLLEELGLKGFGNEEKLSSIVNFSEIESVCRIDAEYFQPKYNIILEKTRKNNGKKLGDLVSMKKGIEVGAEEYQDDGKIFIRVSSMTKFGIVESDQKCLSDKLYESLKKDFEPKKGEILLTKDATLGIAYVLKEDIQSIISGGTLRLKIKDDSVDGEYLALCLNSIIGQMQAERDAGGSVIAHWKPEQIKNVIIPVLPKEIQLKISELVQKSHIARKKSKELLEEAKRKVEEMIESA